MITPPQPVRFKLKAAATEALKVEVVFANILSDLIDSDLFFFGVFSYCDSCLNNEWQKELASL